MTIRLLRRGLVLAAISSVALSVMPASAARMTLSGTITYRDRIALPPAIAEIRLIDASLADAPSTTIASTTIKTDRQVPIPYRLHFDPKSIQTGHRYMLQATISVDGAMWFTTTTAYPVLEGGRNQTDLVLERVPATPAVDAPPVGSWQVLTIQGRDIKSGPQATLEIDRDGSISGTSGCNRVVGEASMTGNRIAFGQMAVTQMACMPASTMEQERRFLDALDAIVSWHVEPHGDRMVLSNAAHKPLLILRRM
ncbi:META domain-containing protein [Acidomonas methanolica]|uniref:META domain-containing protein n=1 Tax=Acidomonas methanolica TaxID=437 RepID=UPI00211A517D|nr:YbaY family lipoprotein [Acidomonas methanolica]MCQ9155952.1 YbaY family lipoprotein [Acidomonas methanolica]